MLNNWPRGKGRSRRSGNASDSGSVSSSGQEEIGDLSLERLRILLLLQEIALIELVKELEYDIADVVGNTLNGGLGGSTSWGLFE